MKYNPIEVMFYEHEIIMQVKEVVRNLDGYWNINASGYSEIVTRLLEFFSAYADGYHHHKEEEVLFPAIKNHPDFNLYDMLDELNDHHQTFRKYTGEIRESLLHGNFQESFKTLDMYFHELIDHIAAENYELFVLAQNLFSNTELTKIYFSFMDIDRELGEERKREFEKVPENLLRSLKLETN